MTRNERLEKLRLGLMSRRDELRHRTSRTFSGKQENESAVGDAADIAQYNVSSDMNSALISMEADQLSEIELALQKFKDNTYGICEYTGKPIPIARLEAMPLTRFSVETQREAEQASSW